MRNAPPPPKSSVGVSSAPRPPGLAKCVRPQSAEREPEEFDHDLFAAQCLAEFAKQVGLSNVEIAEAWGLSESIVRDVMSRRKPFTVSKLMRLPAHERDALFAVLCLRFDQRRRSAA